ncbi:hypothetical protein HDU76_000984 [Blyttiomyces sp. JEL0837]|nr:hypothetical protein HDU76_000984 [Blyttiomyces sp. JEL0837]
MTYIKKQEVADRRRRRQATTTTTSATATPTKLVYYGGPVIAKMEVTTIFYGKNVNYQTELNTFYAGIVNSPWVDWLSEYSTPTQNITRGTFNGTYTETTTVLSALDDVKDLQPYLTTLIKNGSIKPNNNSFYAIHFAPGINVTRGGQGSCTGFCSYHNTMDISSLNIGTKYLYYSVVPDQTGACSTVCGSLTPSINNLYVLASHEIAESITDPAVGVATTLSPPVGWYDIKYGEMSDICEGLSGGGNYGVVRGGDGKNYTVATNWSNEKGKCIVSKPTGSCNQEKDTYCLTTNTQYYNWCDGQNLYLCKCGDPTCWGDQYLYNDDGPGSTCYQGYPKRYNAGCYSG